LAPKTFKEKKYDFKQFADAVCDSFLRRSRSVRLEIHTYQWEIETCPSTLGIPLLFWPTFATKWIEDDQSVMSLQWRLFGAIAWSRSIRKASNRWKVPQVLARLHSEVPHWSLWATLGKK
jgi:hypothetical protein